MLKTIKIQNFKCFENITIELGKITLFSGANSSGKSSAIQALLLVENASKNPNSQLNSNWLNLGTIEETRNFITRGNTLSLEIISDDGEHSAYSHIQNSELEYKTESICSLTSNIYYLSANRVGPQNSYHKNFNAANIVGEKGEFLIDLLNENKRFNVSKERIIDNSSYLLEYQVNYWLQRITQVKLEVEELGISNLVAANYSFNGNSRKVRPYHIGAGISYLIGIIILGLYIEKNSVLIIENPEIHLHPKAQSDLTDFLCFIATAGVQIIIESHSDHIFNGIRKSVFRETISNNDAKIHFFKMNENNLSLNHSISLSNKGKILNYQKGLFDQFDNDIDELIGL